jgi:3-oxoacyl-[acyl-carrier-protein] synthase II
LFVKRNLFVNVFHVEWCARRTGFSVLPLSLHPSSRLLGAVLFPRQAIGRARNSVVVTGIGLITGLGRGWRDNSEGFRLGKSSFRLVTLFDVSRHRAKRAAEVDLPKDVPYGRLRPRAARRLDRAAQLLLTAAEEAWRQAGLEGTTELPIVLGTTSGGMALGEAYYRQALEHPDKNRGQAARMMHYLAQGQPMALAGALGFRGPITIIANACASGANAIGHAAELIGAGRAKMVLTGGYDALSELVFTGFDSLQALSLTECRPFDAQRDGLAIGEGAAVLILESEQNARERGADVLAEVAGYGAATDGHHLTQPQPEGAAAACSMRAACASAGIGPEDINYINAHGTGTPLNDAAEAAAINAWAGQAVGRIPVSSTKASVGHLLGAAGAVEAAVCIMALRGQWLPPMRTLQTPDPQCQFPLAREPASAHLNYALTNSFGFGGANATLIFKRRA